VWIDRGPSITPLQTSVHRHDAASLLKVNWLRNIMTAIQPIGAQLQTGF
jgi:hypothetical protein